jgi:4,5-dihydroxyphthalate decarboxylase
VSISRLSDGWKARSKNRGRTASRTRRRYCARFKSSKTPAPSRSAPLLARGAIDALIGSRKPDELGRHPDVARLFPDYRLLERQFYQQTRIFPIMHLIAIRRDLYERQRWIAESLYNAFVESKQRARRRMRYAGSLSVMLPWLIDDVEEIDEVFGGDAFSYGIEANRATLQALVSYMVEQHFIVRPIPIEDLFVPLAGAIGT